MIYHHITTTQTAYSVTPVSWYITISLQHKQLTLSLQCHDISPYHYNTNSLLCNSSVMIYHHITTTQTAYSVTPVPWYITISLQHKQLTLSLQCHDISPYHYNTNSLLCNSSVMIYHHTTTTQTAYSVTSVSWYITIPLQQINKKVCNNVSVYIWFPHSYNFQLLPVHKHANCSAIGCNSWQSNKDTFVHYWFSSM